MTQPIRLPVIPIPGLTPDSLGNYLASLGLLRLLARNRPHVRIAWRSDVLQLVGGPVTLDDVLDTLCNIGAIAAWAPYQRGWETAQKESSKRASNKKTVAGSGLPFALWQASAGEQAHELLSAHVVSKPHGRTFNPIVPKGGKTGQRDFSKGWERAVTDIKKFDPPTARQDAAAFLEGKGTGIRKEDLNAASWFSNANKHYNSGQRPFRAGLISPWAMVLACEGVIFLAGGASRRLGARSYAHGAFPFVTRPKSPICSGEAGRDSAEFWAPIWNQPMTMPEVSTLFRRGRAEVSGSAAMSPAAFATAILRRGVDAGIVEFRRFVAGWTTAQDYAEPRFEGTYVLPPVSNMSMPAGSTSTDTISLAMERVLDLIERLPRDRKEKKRWRFSGLRGPIEDRLLALAASPSDPEVARDMLDAVVASLDRVDRNRSFRAAKVAWRPLPIEWLPALFEGEQLPVEARLALALVSGFPQSLPFTLYRFGVEWNYQRFEHSEQAPAHWVWGPGKLPRILGTVLLRRTLDWEAEAKRDATLFPARRVFPATLNDVHRWLDDDVDDNLLNRWLARLALFDWRNVPRHVRSLAAPDRGAVDSNGAWILFGLFKPLFDLLPLNVRMNNRTRNLLEQQSGARTPALARSLANLLRTGQVDTAVRMAKGRYTMARTPLIRTHTPWSIADSNRLLAAMLFTVSDRERSTLIQPWLRPQRLTGELSYD